MSPVERRERLPVGGGRRRRSPGADVVRILGRETLVVEIIARRLAEGEPLCADDAEALELAARRIAGIRSAWEMAP